MRWNVDLGLRFREAGVLVQYKNFGRVEEHSARCLFLYMKDAKFFPPSPQTVPYQPSSCTTPNPETHTTASGDRDSDQTGCLDSHGKLLSVAGGGGETKI